MQSQSPYDHFVQVRSLNISTDSRPPGENVNIPGTPDLALILPAHLGPVKQINYVKQWTGLDFRWYGRFP